MDHLVARSIKPQVGVVGRNSAMDKHAPVESHDGAMVLELATAGLTRNIAPTISIH